MTDQMQDIRDDIAYMRALADEGRRAPALGGAILLAGGLIWATTSLVAWAVATRLLSLPIGWTGGIWMVGLAVFFIALATLVRRHKGKPGHSAVNNRVMRTAWTAAGWSILTFVLAASVASWRLHTGTPTAMIGPFVLTVYGVGWTIAASMSDQGWLRWTAVGSFAGAVIMACAADSAAQYLIYAAALLLLVALPGFLLMRQEPSTTV